MLQLLCMKLTNQLEQFSLHKDNDAVQQTPIQDCIHTNFLFHLVLCLPLDKVFPGYTITVSTLL